MERGILLQRAMNARLIIIGGIPAQDQAQMRLPEYDYVIETFPADRADQPLHVRILPRRIGERSQARPGALDKKLPRRRDGSAFLR
jgi:hypothetical protein